MHLTYVTHVISGSCWNQKDDVNKPEDVLSQIAHVRLGRLITACRCRAYLFAHAHSSFCNLPER